MLLYQKQLFLRVIVQPERLKQRLTILGGFCNKMAEPLQKAHSVGSPAPKVRGCFDLLNFVLLYTFYFAKWKKKNAIAPTVMADKKP